MSVENWEREELMATGWYLLQLMKAALLDRKCSEKPADISWESIYELAKMHNVESLMAYGMETLEDKPPKELWEQWKKLPQYVIYRGIRFEIERETIFAEMKQVGLAYLPLKGIYLAGYYPKPGMRTMADNDILFGYVEETADGIWKRKGSTLKEQEQKQEEASHVLKQVMEKLGYGGPVTDRVHDVYKKPPMFNFEMHKGLVSSDSDFYEYYREPWIRAIQSRKNTGEYYFSDEDEYIYLLVHAYKHFSNGGCGVRFLSDIHVFLERKGAQLNRKYVEQELKKLKLESFEYRVTALVKDIFAAQSVTLEEESENMLYYMLSVGTYGRFDVFVQNKLRKTVGENRANTIVGKFLYLKQRVFPDIKWWKKNYPICKSKPYMLPLCWLYRIFIKPFTNGGKTIRELKAVFLRRYNESNQEGK